MARRNTDKNKLTIHDNISGSDVELFFRMPTTKERVDYRNRIIKRDGDKVSIVENVDEIMVDTALDMVTGFRVGDFERQTDGDNYEAFSWDPKDANYYPAWKEWLQENALDLIGPLARKIFVERPVEVAGSIEGK